MNNTQVTDQREEELKVQASRLIVELIKLNSKYWVIPFVENRAITDEEVVEFLEKMRTTVLASFKGEL